MDELLPLKTISSSCPTHKWPWSPVTCRIKTNILFAIPTWTWPAKVSMRGYNFIWAIFFLIRKKGQDQIVLSFLSKYPTVFTKKSKIYMHVCGYTLDLTCLVCPALQSHHLITQKYCYSLFPVKIEILYESCTNIFLFQSHINFNILTHFLNANFEKSL